MISYNIGEDVWKLRFLTDEVYCKSVGDDSRGITNTEAKTVIFNLKYFNKELILHELTHVYLSGLMLDATELNREQIEEVFCELMAHRADSILKHANKIYKMGKKYL